jgi:hypothetical protein
MADDDPGASRLDPVSHQVQAIITATRASAETARILEAADSDWLFITSLLPDEHFHHVAIGIPELTPTCTLQISRQTGDISHAVIKTSAGLITRRITEPDEIIGVLREWRARAEAHAATFLAPGTVTGHFVTNIGPTLHYTLTSTDGHELDYWRDPDGNVGAQIKADNRWIDLAGHDPRHQAVIQGVREHEARNPHLARYNNPQAASTEPRPAKTADRYVVARINKTYRTLGEHPGPQHVGKTFVPYDDRHLTKEAAEESASGSNDRYRPSLHGKTHVPVRAEPIPGTNKFRNLDHPTLTSKAAAKAAEIRAEAAKHGLSVTAELTRDFNPVTAEMDGKVIDATVTVEGTFTPGDARAYIAAEANANTVLGMVRMVRPGSVWGTDSGSVGGHVGLTGGYVRMNKSGAEIGVARHLAQQEPPTGGGPAAPRGNAVSRTAASAAADGFPFPPLHTAPETVAAKARGPATSHARQQVPPPTRGRHQ